MSSLLRELFPPHFPESGFVVLRHPNSPCPKSGTTTILPFQNGSHYESLTELAATAAEVLNHHPIINCNGCGSILKPIKAIPADTTKVTEALDTWRDQRKIPHNKKY